MRFVRFIDHSYQENTMATKTRPFSAFRNGHSNALVFVIRAHSVLTAMLFIPWVFVDYLLVLFRIKDEPTPAVDIYNARLAEQNESKAKIGKSVGFNTSKKNRRDAA